MELEERLLRNRQRLAVLRLRAAADEILGPMAEFADPVVARRLGATLRAELESRRPHQAGALLVTIDRDDFKAAVQSYFSERSGLLFYVFLPHWPDVGALRLSGSAMKNASHQLLYVDGDAVYGCAEDETQVFSLDRSLDGKDGEIFELFYF